MEGQQAMRADLQPIEKPFAHKGLRTGALDMHLPQLVACTFFTPFLPLFYLVVEGKMCWDTNEGKNRVKQPFLY